MTSSTSSQRVPPSLVHDLQAVVPPFRRFLGSSLSANVVLTGLHLEGNLGYVGPRGFLRTIPGRFQDDDATEANESRFRAQILHHPSGKYWGSDRPGGCWICGCWTEHRFTFSNLPKEVSGPVELHLSIDGEAKEKLLRPICARFAERAPVFLHYVNGGLSALGHDSEVDLRDAMRDSDEVAKITSTFDHAARESKVKAGDAVVQQLAKIDPDLSGGAFSSAIRRIVKAQNMHVAVAVGLWKELTEKFDIDEPTQLNK